MIPAYRTIEGGKPCAEFSPRENEEVICEMCSFHVEDHEEGGIDVDR